MALRNDYDMWWCSECKEEWTVRALPHNPNCPRCGRGGWYKRGIDGRPYHYDAPSAVEAVETQTASCSWCHELNPRAEQFCWNCGHEAHRPRAGCECKRCRTGFRRAMLRSRRLHL